MVENYYVKKGLDVLFCREILIACSCSSFYPLLYIQMW